MTLLTRRAALAALTLTGTSLRAQPAPASLLTLIVPYSPGGPADVLARQMEPGLRKSLGQTVIVENVAGASGALGIQKLLAGPADGSKLMLGTPSDVILAPLSLAAVKHKPTQLRLVGVVNRGPLVMVAGSHLPYARIEDLMQAIGKRETRPLTYGSIGPGSLYHLAGEDFAARVHATMTHVPYRGMAPVIQDLIGGQVDVAFLASAGNLAEYIDKGRLRALAVANDVRVARLPNVPTFAEVGLSDFRYEMWGGIFLPRTASVEVAQRINAAVNDVLNDPGMRSFNEASGSLHGPQLSLADADKYFNEQITRFQKLARAVKLDPQ